MYPAALVGLEAHQWIWNQSLSQDMECCYGKVAGVPWGNSYVQAGLRAQSLGETASGQTVRHRKPICDLSPC